MNDELKKADEIVRALRNCGGGPEGMKIAHEAADLIDSLTAQLTESQRREKAAVADMKHGDNCDVCVGSGIEPDACDCECARCELDCRCRECRDESKFEWRGPQEAEKGEASV